MKRRLVAALSIAALTVGLGATGAQAKSVGGCPRGGDWDLVTVESLDLPSEIVSGLASLDGNGDGWTCIKPLANFPAPEVLIFRDNTVQG
jgi:hypothetical protein